MNNGKPQDLSNAEPIQLLQCLHRRIDELVSVVADLELRVTEVEAQLDDLGLVVQSVASSEESITMLIFRILP